MQWTVIALGGLLAFSGLLIWLSGGFSHTEGTRQSAAVAVGLPSISVTRPPGTSLDTTSGPVTIEGTAIMDTSSGLPAVPYISYTNSDGGRATKQLIFADSRGCLPGAGDIPCVPSYPEQSAYPKLATGQRIRVEGVIRENRLLVESISVES